MTMIKKEEDNDMKGQKEGASGPKRKIADEILVQIGNSVSGCGGCNNFNGKK